MVVSCLYKIKMVSDITTGPEFLLWVKKKRSKTLPIPPSSDPFSGLVTSNLYPWHTPRVTGLEAGGHTWVHIYLDRDLARLILNPAKVILNPTNKD